jgi:hypothetical protein
MFGLEPLRAEDRALPQEVVDVFPDQFVIVNDHILHAPCLCVCRLPRVSHLSNSDPKKEGLA